MTRKEEFKQNLARVFDSDLRTAQWQNLVDYLIIALIIISTVSIFISTFDVSPSCQRILHIIDFVTVITFTIYSFADRYNQEENLPLYMEDLEKLSSREGAWTITPLVASGANEPSYPTIFHFSAGGPKGDETFEGKNLIVDDMAAYRAFYEDITSELEANYLMTSDHQRYHNVSSANLFARKYEQGKGARNNIVLRIAWSACLWDSRRIAIAKTIADVINRHFEKDVEKKLSGDLKIKMCGY